MKKLKKLKKGDMVVIKKTPKNIAIIRNFFVSFFHEYQGFEKCSDYLFQEDIIFPVQEAFKGTLAPHVDSFIIPNLAWEQVEGMCGKSASFPIPMSVEAERYTEVPEEVWMKFVEAHTTASEATPENLKNAINKLLKSAFVTFDPDIDIDEIQTGINTAGGMQYLKEKAGSKFLSITHDSNIKIEAIGKHSYLSHPEMPEWVIKQDEVSFWLPEGKLKEAKKLADSVSEIGKPSEEEGVYEGEIKTIVHEGEAISTNDYIKLEESEKIIKYIKQSKIKSEWVQCFDYLKYYPVARVVQVFEGDESICISTSSLEPECEDLINAGGLCFKKGEFGEITTLKKYSSLEMMGTELGMSDEDIGELGKMARVFFVYKKSHIEGVSEWSEYKKEVRRNVVCNLEEYDEEEGFIGNCPHFEALKIPNPGSLSLSIFDVLTDVKKGWKSKKSVSAKQKKPKKGAPVKQKKFKKGDWVKLEDPDVFLKEVHETFDDKEGQPFGVQKQKCYDYLSEDPVIKLTEVGAHEAFCFETAFPHDDCDKKQSCWGKEDFGKLTKLHEVSWEKLIDSISDDEKLAIEEVKELSEAGTIFMIYDEGILEGLLDIPKILFNSTGRFKDISHAFVHVYNKMTNIVSNSPIEEVSNFEKECQKFLVTDYFFTHVIKA